MDTVKLLIISIFYLNCHIFCQEFPVRFWQPPEQSQQQQPLPQWQPQQPQQWQQPQQQSQHFATAAVPMPPPPPNFRFIPFEDENERVVEARRWSLIPTRSITRATVPPPPTTTTVEG